MYIYLPQCPGCSPAQLNLHLWEQVPGIGSFRSSSNTQRGLDTTHPPGPVLLKPWCAHESPGVLLRRRCGSVGGLRVSPGAASTLGSWTTLCCPSEGLPGPPRALAWSPNQEQAFSRGQSTRHRAAPTENPKEPQDSVILNVWRLHGWKRQDILSWVFKLGGQVHTCLQWGVAQPTSP